MKALLLNMTIGILAILTGKTGDIITIACFGALALYIISMLSFFKLRKNEPDLVRPFKVPGHPIVPGIALFIASVSFVAMTYHNIKVALIFFAIMGISFGIFKLSKKLN